MQKAKILIVDDSATDRLIIKNMLVNHEVFIACDGNEALNLLDQNSDIDIMILDLNMPNMDGFEVLKKLKSNEKYHRMRTIILTNFDELDKEIMGLKLGAVDYVRKPINMESLIVRIETQLELLNIQKLFEQKLYEGILTLQTLLDKSPIGIAITFSDQGIIYNNRDMVNVNNALLTITGRTIEELSENGWPSITHPDDIAKDMELFKRLETGEINNYTTESRYIKPDNSIVWVNITVANLNIKNEHKYNYIYLVQDITNRKNIEMELLDSERSKSVLLDDLPGMMYRCKDDPNWTMLFVSNGCYELTGYFPESLIDNRDLTFNDLIVKKYQDYIWKQWKKAVKTHSKFAEEYEIITADGTHKWVWEQGQALYSQNDKVIALEGLIIDITDRKNNEIELKYLSQHDLLSGLLNLRSLEEIYSNIKETSNKTAFIMIYVLHFSHVNSALGYRLSNKLVKEIADCLSITVNNEFQLFHTYIDRFLIYVTNYQNKDDLIALSEKLITKLNMDIKQKSISFHNGILEINANDNYDVDHLLKRVSVAAESINDSDQKSYCFFTKAMADKQEREISIAQCLSDVLIDNDDTSFFMQYQPIIDLKNNKIVEFEALARFANDKLGVVSPSEFIPILESSQLILPLGKKIMHIVFDFAKRLSKEGYESIIISFNISSIQLLNDSFIPDLATSITEASINPFNIKLEITESVFADNYTEINKKLAQIKQMGITIAIDDFGTGYSSLAREEELNVNCLKIDKYFVDKLLNINKDKSLISDIISMAHKLGHYVIAEGVEEEIQRKYLIDHNCDMMQGYLFSKAVNEDEVLKLLKDNNTD